MKFLKITACLISLCLLFTSCTVTSRNINDLTVVQALSFDTEKSKTKISIQYLNLSSESSDAKEHHGNITGVFTGEGKNISSALSNASRGISNVLFFGQNKIVVFGMEYAKNSIDKGLEYLLKSADSRPDVIAAISSTSGEEVIKSKFNSSRIPAESLYNLLKLGEENAQGAAVTVCDLLNLYNDETSDIFLPVLKASENNVICEGIAVFSNEKYAKTLSYDETLGFLLVKNKVKNAQTNIKTDSLGTVSLSITSAKSKRSVKIRDSKIYFNADIKLKCQINEAETPINKRLNEDDYNELEKSCEKRIKSVCKGAIKECFKNKSDPFMSARYLYKEDTELYNSLRKNWRSNLENIGFNVNVKVLIQRVNSSG